MTLFAVVVTTTAAAAWVVVVAGFQAAAPPPGEYYRRGPVRFAEAVVVTGVGVVSALGTQESNEFWEKLTSGETGIGRVEEQIPDVERFACQIGAEVKDFDAKKWFANPKTANSNDRYTHFAMAAARMAVDDAALPPPNEDEARRRGVLIGSAFGGMGTIERELARMKDRGPRKVSPFAIPSMLANTASGIVGIELGYKGPNFAVLSACASGSHAIGEAFHSIRRGEADVVVAGGSEAAITELMYAGFGAMKAMCTKYNDDPASASRPFDKDRAGFVQGEGAGVVVLETLSHARARNARIYAELKGYGATCDAHHITSPEPTGAGLAQCLRMALDAGGVSPTDVGYVNAHGTSTPYNDKFETMALRTVFGDHADHLKVSSTKGATGHTLGAAGGIEAVATVLALHAGHLPPTINLQTPDPDCDLDYVPHAAVPKADFSAAISENLGFGGHNAALLFARY
ncbi:hypothetical protein CTAYLR_007983 [Chrysophaeum taylorii]|uniref:3-oxoacyl-[acyl-carrier-protein] synthase n=1 Tax=Chrysophaeum taylorii TaxID=2483200 RepID=A0AAD7U7U5_9STRA|nr:hypothetical protein CTAYLR_007983 [Chrysophaeum taylorii]